jgi:hypothetical protein
MHHTRLEIRRFVADDTAFRKARITRLTIEVEDEIGFNAYAKGPPLIGGCRDRGETTLLTFRPDRTQCAILNNFKTAFCLNMETKTSFSDYNEGSRHVTSDT